MVTEEPINGKRKELSVVARRADFFVEASFMGVSFIIEERRRVSLRSIKGSVGKSGGTSRTVSVSFFACRGSLRERAEESSRRGG